MTTTTNFGLPIYGNGDKPKWTDTNKAFQDLDNKVADKTADNAFTGTNAFNADLLMKGGSTIESDDGVITPTAPSSDKTGTDVIQINDSASNPLYKVRPIQHSNGKVDLDIAGQPAANGGTLTFNGEPVGGKHVYSTNEHVVGTWIDGKPIYEAIFYGSIGNSSTESTNQVVTGVSTLVNANGFATQDGTDFIIPQATTNECLRFLRDSSNRVNLLVRGSYFTGAAYCAILQYTKV